MKTAGDHREVRRSEPASSILPDRFAAQRIRPALERLAAARLIERLWAKDASLWTNDPAEQAQIRRRLGWLSIVPVMEAQAGEIQAFAEECRQAGFTHALLLGMGGSSLFPEVCRALFGVLPGWLDVAILDSTDPTLIRAAAQRAPLERTLVVVASKSGTTIESASLCDYFYDRLRATVGAKAGAHFAAVTDAGTTLETLGAQRGFRRVFTHGPQTGQDVGGRFSALTYFGLVPAALIGMDIRRLLARATSMLQSCAPSRPIADNPAAQLAAFLSEASTEGRDKITMASTPALEPFGAWVEQLIAESTGKAGKGLVPVVGERLRDPASYGSDRAFVDLRLAGEPDGALATRIDQLAHAGYPVIRLRWQDRYDLGGEVVRWCLATSLAASLMQLNAFDEPNVQESKDRTNALLDRLGPDGSLPSEPPLATWHDLAIYGPPSDAGSSASGILTMLFQRARPGDYLVLASFLPRTDPLDRETAALRDRIAERLGLATMFDYGPRYLHSTGQLHKGGLDRLIMLCLTSDDPIDLPIPGKPYTFSLLKRAQALGDCQALQERGRRVLRLHLGASPDAGLQHLRQLVETALPATPIT